MSRSPARMYAALACGGALDGVRLLSPETLARATEVQASVGSRRLVVPFDTRWRLGYHGVLTTRGVPKQAFGHFGFGGSGAWAERRRELAVALICNCGRRIVRVERIEVNAGAAVSMPTTARVEAPGRSWRVRGR